MVVSDRRLNIWSICMVDENPNAVIWFAGDINLPNQTALYQDTTTLFLTVILSLTHFVM